MHRRHTLPAPTMTFPQGSVCICVGLAIGLLAAPRSVRAEGRTVMLFSHAGSRPRDADARGRALLEAMAGEAPLYGQSLRRALEERFSRSAGPPTLEADDRARLEQGRREFIEGNYERSIALLEQVRRRMIDRVAAVAANQAHRDSLHQTLLFLAHAHLRARQPGRATERVSEVIRSFADRDLSLAKHSPDLVRFYKRVRSSLRGKARGSLRVATRPSGCMVFVNERFVGVSPTTTNRLLPGEYRVYVQRGNRRGRVHPVMVPDEQQETITIDFDFDQRLVTHPYIGFRFDDDADQQERQLRYAATVGQALHAPLVVLLDLGRYDGRRMLEATVVASATGRAVRSARVALEPASPAPDTYARLGRFLLAGQPAPGIIVARPPLGPDAGGGSGSEDGSAGDRAAGGGFFSARVFKWITAALGAGAVAGGVTLIAIDGQGTCDAPEGVACRDVYQTKAAGVGLTIGGALLAATSAYLFYRDARRAPRQAATARRAPRQAATARRAPRQAATARRATRQAATARAPARTAAPTDRAAATDGLGQPRIQTWIGPGTLGLRASLRF